MKYNRACATIDNRCTPNGGAARKVCQRILIAVTKIGAETDTEDTFA